jgi:hypothetical protein
MVDHRGYANNGHLDHGLFQNSNQINFLDKVRTQLQTQSSFAEASQDNTFQID